MTSLERKEKRYQRRKAKRNIKKQEFIGSLGSFDDVFSFENLYYSFYLCRKGVRWKASVQGFEANLGVNIYNLLNQLHNDKWKTKGFKKFILSERGKVRQIQSVHISERVIQRTLCDHYLVPLLTQKLIYDNGASLKGKGVDFAINRLKKHLNKHIKKYGNKGYILLFDFTNYFGNISHEQLYKMVDEEIKDDRIKKLYHQLIDAFDEGLGLGSQVSQISAVYFANKIDHYFKDKKGIKGYARYMDDGYIISDNLDFIKECENDLKELCKKYKIVLKPHKIKICKIDHGFTFLKKTFICKDNGIIDIKLLNKAFKATKRRLKKMYDKKLPIKEVWTSYNSWRGTTKNYSNRNRVYAVDRYYNKLFIEPFVRGEYYG